MKCSCPNCHRSLQLDQPLPTQVHCPHCNATFLMDAATAAKLASAANVAKSAPTMSMRPVTRDATKTGTMYPVAQGITTPPPTAALRPAAVAKLAPPATRSMPPWVVGVTIGGFGLLLLVGLAIAIYCFTMGAANQKTTENAQVLPVGNQKLEHRDGLRDPKNTDKSKPKKNEPSTSDTKKEKVKENPPPKEKSLPVEPMEKEKPLPVEKEKEKPPSETKSTLQVKLIETVKRKEVKRDVRLAISKPHFDNMGQLLITMGKGYNQFTELSEKELEDFAKLKEFDVIFLTCQRSTSQNFRLNSALRRFVEDGGTLYASDLRFDVLRGAFPDYIDIPHGREGKEQNTFVDIVDPGLREILGEKVELHFDSGGWKPATFKRDMVTVYMEGHYRPFDRMLKEKLFEPLLVKFRCKKGSVIFTSFHNSKQNSEVEGKLLRYLVLTAITSFEETRAATTMISGGFSPQPARRLTTSDDAPSATQVFHNKKAGRLQFALGFSNAGAKLRLELAAPNGEKVVQEGTATFVIEVDNAAAGDWRYTVTALRVPYPNFPFTLSVGEAVPK